MSDGLARNQTTIVHRSRNPAYRQQLAASHDRPHQHHSKTNVARPQPSAASLERLNAQEFGTSVLMVRRKRSHASIRGSPIRQFFIRLFRRRSRPKYFYNKSQLTRRPSARTTGIVSTLAGRTGSLQTTASSVVKPKSRIGQFRFQPFQLFNFRPLPVRRQTPIIPNYEHGISSPLQVTKYVGIDPSGSPELLSINRAIPLALFASTQFQVVLCLKIHPFLNLCLVMVLFRLFN